MPQELIPSFLFYCLLSSISPGASNLASRGASLNCERRRALRQWYGMITGFLILSVIALVAVAGNLLWLVAGVFMKGVFQKHRKAANTVMALALLLCAANLLISSLKM